MTGITISETVGEQDRFLYIPEGFDRPPETVVEALTMGLAVLREDGRWVQRELYVNPRPEEDPSTPYCNGWGACAIGGLQVVTVGLRPSYEHCVYGEVEAGTHRCNNPECEDCRVSPVWCEAHGGPRQEIFTQAVALLDDETMERSEGMHSSVVEYNDHDGCTFDEVEGVFVDAIRAAEAVDEDAIEDDNRLDATVSGLLDLDAGD